jgi:hypothetical protein
MTTYRSYKALFGKELKYLDILIFNKDGLHTYEVQPTFLQNRDGRINGTIFYKLWVSAMEFCSEAYGYTAKGGDCPTCKDEDYAALTRLALKIFELCEGKPKYKIVNGVITL